MHPQEGARDRQQERWSCPAPRSQPLAPDRIPVPPPWCPAAPEGPTGTDLKHAPSLGKKSHPVSVVLQQQVSAVSDTLLAVI